MVVSAGVDVEGVEDVCDEGWLAFVTRSVQI
jgi:hypothetical protein